jgi:YD repeat-containing protein
LPAISYAYDVDGDLLSRTDRNQLTSDGCSTYTYAADGAVASQTSAQGAVTSFTLDAYQQQVTAGTSSYGYDGLGRLLTGGRRPPR